MTAWYSRMPKAGRLIMLASFSLMTLTRMEVAVAGPVVTQQAIQVEHDAEIKWKAMINATKDQLKAAPEFKFEGKFKR